MYEQDKEWNVKPLRLQESELPPVTLHRLVGRLRSWYLDRKIAHYERRENTKSEGSNLMLSTVRGTTICGHRLCPSLPECTLPAGHADKWHRHHKTTVPNASIERPFCRKEDVCSNG